MITDRVHDAFVANRVIILFTYGQVFFVLGLVIALQSWRHSRLALAHSLKWLAAFGFSHGLHEWGHVFIPIQAEHVPSQIAELLVGLQVMLLAVSFGCLFQFGVETLRPLPDHQRWLRFAPSASMALWITITIGPTLTNAGDVLEWQRLSSIWARYLIGFPGALMAAHGLRRQAVQLAAVMTPPIQQALHIASLALVGYAVVGGLAVPSGGFFPADWFNSERLQRLTLVPVEVYRSVCGLTLALSVIRLLELFRTEVDRLVAGMEEAQVLAVERERIGRELHDGTLQTIYAAGLLLQRTGKELVDAGAEQGAERLRQSVDLLDKAVDDIRGYIGMLRAPTSSLSLVAGLEEVVRAHHLRSQLQVELVPDLPQDRTLAPANVAHLLAIAGEALSNVTRHAQATNVRLTASSAGDRLRLAIQDNGRGLPTDLVVGYGLRNMRDRARLLGGSVAIDSRAGRGTNVTVDVPWNEEVERHATPDRR